MAPHAVPSAFKAKEEHYDKHLSSDILRHSSAHDEYVEKAAGHHNEYGDPVEECEIQFIDGDNRRLFEAVSVNQVNLRGWFEKFEELDGDDAIKIIYLTEDLGYRLEDSLEHLDDVALFEGAGLDKKAVTDAL